MMFTNEFYYNVEEEIGNYVRQLSRKLSLFQIMELPAVERILENSFDKFSKEPRQIYHHIHNSIKNRRFLYPVVTTYLIRKLPEEYYIKKIFNSKEKFSSFDDIMKHSFELPVNRRVYTHESKKFKCEIDSVIAELFRKLEGYDEKIRTSSFFHKYIFDCPLNQCIKNWKFLHVLLKMYKFSFDEQWKKQYKRLVNKIIPASFKNVGFIATFEKEESDESDGSDESEESDDESDGLDESYESYELVVDVRNGAIIKNVDEESVEELEEKNEIHVYDYSTRKSNKMKLQNIKGDGNCLFNAISYYLYGNQDEHVQIRQRAVEYIRNNLDDFRIDPSLNIENYARLNTWGDGIIMTAISKHYRINIKVFLPRQNRLIDGAYTPEFTENTVYLYFTGNHFDLLQKYDQPDNITGSLFDTFTWSGLYDYLIYYENYVVPPTNYCSYSMNYNFFHVLLERVDLVMKYAKDSNRYDECSVILRRIEVKMRGRYIS